MASGDDGIEAAARTAQIDGADRQDQQRHGRDELDQVAQRQGDGERLFRVETQQIGDEGHAGHQGDTLQGIELGVARPRERPLPLAGGKLREPREGPEQQT